jgi:hypothetical protein
MSRLERMKPMVRESAPRLGSRLDLGLLVVLLLPIFVVLPLLQPGLPRTADGYLHLLRAVEVDRSWQDGVYYPRWAPDMAFGYGYPVFNYFAPLLYHLIAAVHLTGLWLQTSLKVVLIGCIVLGGLGVYSLAKDLFGARSAVLAAACYVYAPYPLKDLFVRGAYAEFLALSLMPATLWAFNRLVTRGKALYMVTAPTLCAAVILSHNISAMLFLPVLVGFAAWSICSTRRWYKARDVTLALALALCLTAFFWVPALAEKPAVKLDRMTEAHFDFRNHFLTLKELLSPSVEPDSSAFNPVWLYNIGTAQLVLAGLGALVVLTGPVGRRQRLQGAFFLVVMLAAAFMTLSASKPVWEHVPLLAFTGFPWRFLGIAVLAGSVLAVLSVSLWTRVPWRHAGMVFLALSLVLTVTSAFVHLYGRWPHGGGEEITAKDVVLYEKSSGVIGTTGASEAFPIWVVEEPKDSPLVSQYLSSSPISKLDEGSLPESAQAELLAHSVVSDEYRFVAVEPFTARFNTIYFPGWQAFVDGGSVPVTPSYPDGLITVQVPAGEHRVLVRFADTPVRTLANIVSGAGLVATAGITLFLWAARRRRRSGEVQGSAENRVPFAQAALLAGALLLLFVVKTAVIDPSTTWFRKSSPPGQVIGAQNSAHLNLGDEVRLLGYDISSESVVPGGTLEVTLYWEAQRRSHEDYSVFLHLDDLRPNYVSWSTSEELSPADLPTSSWVTGFYVSDHHVLNISRETPPALYVLRAGMYRPDSGERLSVLDEEGNTLSDSIELARIRVRRTTPLDLSGVTMEGPFSFGDRVKLIGYTLGDARVTPGSYARLVLYWEALKEMEEGYTVFVHVVDDQGQTRAQADGVPMAGMYPTWTWLQGEVLADEHLVPVEIDVEPGTYRLAIGLYESDTLRRLEAKGPQGNRLGDQIVLQTPLEIASPQ